MTKPWPQRMPKFIVYAGNFSYYYAFSEHFIIKLQMKLSMEMIHLTKLDFYLFFFLLFFSWYFSFPYLYFMTFPAAINYAPSSFFRLSINLTPYSDSLIKMLIIIISNSDWEGTPPALFSLQLDPLTSIIRVWFVSQIAVFPAVLSPNLLNPFWEINPIHKTLYQLFQQTSDAEAHSVYFLM